MGNKISVVIAFAAFCGIFSACGDTEPNANTKLNAARKDTNNPVSPPPATNNAPTLTPVFKAYCDAWLKNDEAALKKIYSEETLKTFESQMKEEKQKSLLKFLETDRVKGQQCEITNEQISGDKASATIRTNVYPRGLAVEFVKEGGEWKLTNRSPAISSVTGNTNAAGTAK
jgi:hypothetical protein